MKTLMVLFFSLLFAFTGLAQDVELSAERKSVIVDNLTNGIVTDNNGLNASSAIVLYDLIDQGYMESNNGSKAMIPLLRLLNNGETEEVKIAAALALYKLGNGIGIYRLRGASIFDDNENVSSVCKNLYYSYHKINGSEYFLNF
ncbi:MAG: hypothetical protein PVF17_02355 [Ignavibacteria bacterium]|jgi:hypothetical protein